MPHISSLHPDEVWYCVIRVDDLSTVYHGRDESQALSCHNSGTVLATGDTRGDAERLAAIQAGKRKHG